MGTLALKAATDPAQALDFFDKMAALAHRLLAGTRQARRLCNTGPAGLPSRNHQQRSWSRPGGIAGTVGRQPSAGLSLQFSIWRRVYNYQSGFSYSDDNRHRPGLIAHAWRSSRRRSAACGSTTSWRERRPTKPGWDSGIGQVIWCRGQRNRPLLACERAARRPVWQAARPMTRLDQPRFFMASMPTGRQLLGGRPVLELRSACQQGL